MRLTGAAHDGFLFGSVSVEQSASPGLLTQMWKRTAKQPTHVLCIKSPKFLHFYLFCSDARAGFLLQDVILASVRN
jgi:hypothetical protein